MIAFILAEPNLPFAVALGLMLAIALLEGIATVFGMGISGVLDSLLPEIDVDVDLDIDADIDGPDIHTGGLLSGTLGWLHVGRVPILALFVLFLTAFGLLGLGVQSFADSLAGRLLPAFPAGVIAFFLSLPVVRLLGGILARLIPKDETEAVSEKSFIGLVAVISLGTARQGKPAQGKLTDRYGQSHYIMIEPDDPKIVFSQGEAVLLVSQHGATFRAIHRPAVLETD